MSSEEYLKVNVSDKHMMGMY